MSVPALKSKFFWLLLSLLAFVIITPFIVDSQLDMYLFGSLFSVLLLSSVYAITHNRWLIVTAVILASLIFIGLWVNNLLLRDPGLLIAEYILMSVFFLMITVVVIREVIKDNVINFNTLCGAICGYLLIGMLWSLFFSLIYILHTNSFDIPKVPHVIFDSHF